MAENEKKNAKEYLLSVARQKAKLNQVSADLETAIWEAYGLSGVTLTERVQTSMDPTWAIQSLVDEVERLKKVQEREAKKLIEVRQEVLATIRLVPNAKHRQVLECRYARCMRLNQVAKRLGRSHGYVRNIHGEALESYRKVNSME